MLSRTSMGRTIRAVADDREAAELVGINHRHVFGIAAAIALATVALAGLASGMITEFAPATGTNNLLFAFEAVVIGGIGSLWGTLVGGMVLGIAQQIGAQINPAYQILAGHVVFLAVLAFRFARTVRGAGGGLMTAVPGMLTPSAIDSPADRFRVRRSARPSAWSVPVAAGAVVLFAFMPALVSAGDTSLLVNVFILLTISTMWNLMAGYAGMVSIGQQAFIGLGAYAVLIGAIHGMEPFTVIPIAAIVSAVIALPISYLVFRTKGGYFAIATWVVASTAELVISSITSIGGGTGHPVPGLSSLSPTQFGDITYWSALAVVVVSLAITYLLLRSRLGLVLSAVRDDEEGALAAGARVMTARRIVYLVAALGCGAAGALLAVSQLQVQPASVFSVQFSAEIIFVTLIGGMGTIEGPIIGTIIYFALQQNLSQHGAWYLIIVGTVAVVIAIWLPRGLWGTLTRRLRFEFFPVGYFVVPEKTAKNQRAGGAKPK